MAIITLYCYYTYIYFLSFCQTKREKIHNKTIYDLQLREIIVYMSRTFDNSIKYKKPLSIEKFCKTGFSLAKCGKFSINHFVIITYITILR